MTPNELLNLVKNQFVTLYHDEEAKLNALLFQALSEYQDKAGVIKSVVITNEQQKEGGVELPPYFLTVVSACDIDCIYHETQIIDNRINVVTNNYSQAPFTLNYLEAISLYDFDDDQLPTEIISLLMKYLKVLIEIPNSEREIYAKSIAGLPFDGVPQPSELLERKRQLEEEMEEHDNFLLPAMILQV